METVKARLGVSPSTQHPAPQLDFIRLGHIPRGVVSKLTSHESEVQAKLSSSRLGEPALPHDKYKSLRSGHVQSRSNGERARQVSVFRATWLADE